MESPEAYGLRCLRADDLVPIWQHEQQRVVNARDLHRSLEIPLDFTTWVKRKIGQHRFNHGADYVQLTPEKTLLLKSEEQKSDKRGGHNRTEYAFSLDAAKMIAMGTNNAIGDRIKRYFLTCEKLILMPRVEPIPRQRVMEHVFIEQQIANSKAAQRFLAKHGANVSIGYHRNTYAEHIGMTGRQIKQVGRQAGLKGPDLANGRAVLRKLEPAIACALSLQDHLMVFEVPRAEAIRIAAGSHDLFDAILETGKFELLEISRRR